MIDFIIHFKKANGKNAEKVFKLKRTELDSGQSMNISKKYSFAVRTTRKLYPGEHFISLKVNGQVWGMEKFELLEGE